MLQDKVVRQRDVTEAESSLVGATTVGLIGVPSPRRRSTVSPSATPRVSAAIRLNATVSPRSIRDIALENGEIHGLGEPVTGDPLRRVGPELGAVARAESRQRPRADDRGHRRDARHVPEHVRDLGDTPADVDVTT